MRQQRNYRIFVYGTLKSGRGNNGLLRGATLIGKALLHTSYTLHDFGGFPGLVRTKRDEHKVVGGEVWEVDSETLESVDGLEGHPGWYTREPVNTSLGEAWVYTLPDGTRYSTTPKVEVPFWRQTPDEEKFLEEHNNATAS